MPIDDENVPQGPIVGSRCLAGPTGRGRWGLATIRRVNEDGTFRVEFDVKEMIVLPYWYGVTPAEISFDDVRQWSPVFARISPDGRSFARTNFADALTSLGYQLPLDHAQVQWDQGCSKVCHVPPEQAESRVLDEATAYRLFLELGLSAKYCADLFAPDKPKPYFKLYWNQNRMGGRDPSELPRPVTLDDTFAVLGLTKSKADRSTAAFLQRLQRDQGLRLPASLAELLCRRGIARAVTECHPNSPRLVEFKASKWKLRRGMREQQLSGDYALTIMLPHQGDHEWAVVFDDGEDDARVYLHWERDGEATWLLTAPRVGLFFWDLAQTGLTWYVDTLFRGGKPVRDSDIGLILDS
jgi:hypothetical protein